MNFTFRLKSIYFGEIVDKPPILMYCQLVVMNTDMVDLGHFLIESHPHRG